LESRQNVVEAQILGKFYRGHFAAAAFQSDPSSLKACQFAYNREFMERIALPTLKREEGDVYYVFDAKDPAITRRADGTILLIFDQKTGVIDAPLFTINFDPCSSRVISAGEVSSFPPA
jgi:hypothetical protein